MKTGQTISKVRDYAVIIVIATFLFAISIGLYELFIWIGLNGLFLYACTGFIWAFSVTMLIEILYRSIYKEKKK